MSGYICKFLCTYAFVAAKVEQTQRLSVERQLYEKTKKELNQRNREEKEIHQKENNEAQLRYAIC